MRRQWFIILTGVFLLILVSYHSPEHIKLYCRDDPWTLVEDDFEGFDNETGTSGTFIVPNFIHFLRVGPNTKEFTFIDTAVVLSAFKNQKPEKIFFHTDQEFTGHFWNVLVHTEGFMEVVEFVPTDIPEEIFGQKFDKEFHLFHAGDILRIRLLMKYGGIFLDNDSFLVRSLDVFRKFEMTLGWDEGQTLGTQVLVAHKDARFLRLWQNSYKDNYIGSFWYYNAGERPTGTILLVRPELVHRVKMLFGVHDLRVYIYQKMWEDWRKQYAIHLLIRHYKDIVNYPYKLRHYKHVENSPYKLPNEFTPDNIHSYSITLATMVDSVFDYTLHKSLLG